MDKRIRLSDIAIPIAILALMALSLSVLATSVPPGFIENKGQIHDQFRKPNADVLFLMNGERMNVQLQRAGFAYDTYSIEEGEESADPLDRSGSVDPLERPASDVMPITFRFHRIDLRFVNGNADAEIVTEDRSKDYTNYYTDITGEAGATFVRSYTTITYRDVWPNIDVRFHSGKTGFKYDVVVRPGGDPKDVQFKVGGAAISESLKGRLLFTWNDGTLEEMIPESWVELDGKRQRVEVSYRINSGAQFGFNAPSQGKGTLVIDPYPDLYWATYYGGSLGDYFSGVAMDGAGAAYASGSTKSATSIATAGSFDAVFTGSENAMIVKMNPTGARAWATYFGGTGYTSAYACAYGAGAIWIGGRTDSPSGMATAGAFQPNRDPFSADAFLAKFNPVGTRLYASYLGGRAADAITDIAVDAGGWIVVGGFTDSDNVIATIGSADPTYGGNTDGFVSRFTPAGARSWGSYIGGPSADRVSGVTLLSGGIAVCGTTSSSSGVASPGAWDTALSGSQDAFLASFTFGGQRAWSTYFGGTGSEDGYDCAWNGGSFIALCGHTNSSASIATAGAQQTTFGGGADAFLASFSTSAGNRIWATYAGGTCWDDLKALSYNGFGQWVACGATCSDLGMATPGAYDITHDWYDLLITGYDATGARLWATYLGGSVPEYSSDVVAGGNLAYVVGETHTPGTFATSGAHQTTYGGGLSDGIMARLNLTPPAFSSPVQGTGAHVTGTLEARIDGGRIRLQLVPEPDVPFVPSKGGTITLFDVCGRTIRAENWPAGSTSAQLPIDAQSTGLITAVLSLEDGSSQVARIAVP